jgi:6-phosphofructokinase
MAGLCLRMLENSSLNSTCLLIVCSLFTHSARHCKIAPSFLGQLRVLRPLSIVGVPKSIDNDIVFFDKTFGWDLCVVDIK